MTTKQRVFDVVIVGGGPSGLIAAKALLEKNNDLKHSIVVFDESSAVGGLWNKDASRQHVDCVCTDSTTGDVVKVQASSQPIYQNLKTNFPKDMSSFLGFPYKAEVNFFPDPEIVFEYYKAYAEQFELNRYIHLNMRVETCKKNMEQGLWDVHTKDLKTGQIQHFKTKRVLVCNGHFRKAFVPDIAGIKLFHGQIVHSSAFDSINSLCDKTVLIVGGYISGADITSMITKSYASYSRVIVSVRKWKFVHKMLLKNSRKRGAIIRGEIDYISANGEVHFKPTDGKGYSKSVPPTEKPDIIIFATGYRYWFPFLSKGKFLSDPDGFKMECLYKRILFTDDTSLAFMGVTNQNLSPAISLEYQAKWLAQIVVKENCQSLTTEIMEAEVKSRRYDKTQDALLSKFPAYCNSLAYDIKERGYWTQLLVDRLPLHLRSLWTHGHSSIYWIITLVVIPFVGVIVIAAKYVHF